MHAKSSHKTQTALGLWKDVGHLKNRNGWQFVGDGGSSQFIVTSCCNASLCVAELVHLPAMYVICAYSSGLSVHNSQWTNSATHSGALQQLVTMNCDEPPSPTNCHPFLFFRCPTSLHKPSAVYVLWLLFACIQLSVLKTSEDYTNFILIELGKVNLIFLTEWQEESFQCLRYSDLSSNSSRKLFFPCYLSAQLFVILIWKCLPIKVAVQILQLTYVTPTEWPNDQPSVFTFCTLHFCYKIKFAFL